MVGFVFPPLIRTLEVWSASGSVIPPVSQSDVLQHGAAGWNSMLFVQATLADLDRLDPESLFCLTQSNDKSVCERLFPVLRNVCVCVCSAFPIFLSMSANKQLPSNLARSRIKISCLFLSCCILHINQNEDAKK